MDEILWIRAADYDPSVQPGSQIRPDPSLPVFDVLDRRQVVMMYNPSSGGWEVKPFTQLTLRLVERSTAKDWKTPRHTGDSPLRRVPGSQ